ncbi:hypothetical protein YA0089_13955 [Pseudomonas viridiflava]|uniref:hypothetical protein n=1 Tax=Pseudomonas viridiflava TaxID=33069 RepID=UPI0018E5E8D6|nr:hypothetical protein [Pseudomonas viridiflava]MBI6724723.1 hypothetical protein [Pseudomonas viridiflava]
MKIFHVFTVSPISGALPWTPRAKIDGYYVVAQSPDDAWEKIKPYVDFSGVYEAFAAEKRGDVIATPTLSLSETIELPGHGIWKRWIENRAAKGEEEEANQHYVQVYEGAETLKQYTLRCESHRMVSHGKDRPDFHVALDEITELDQTLTIQEVMEDRKDYAKDFGVDFEEGFPHVEGLDQNLIGALTVSELIKLIWDIGSKRTASESQMPDFLPR